MRTVGGVLTIVAVLIGGLRWYGSYQADVRLRVAQLEAIEERAEAIEEKLEEIERGLRTSWGIACQADGIPIERCF